MFRLSIILIFWIIVLLGSCSMTPSNPSRGISSLGQKQQVCTEVLARLLEGRVSDPLEGELALFAQSFGSNKIKAIRTIYRNSSQGEQEDIIAALKAKASRGEYGCK